MATASDAVIAIDVDDDALAVTVAELLSTAIGQDVRVDGLRREPSPFATLFPAEVLTLSLYGKAELRLFLKHLGPEQPGQPDKQRRDREVRVYDELLRDDGLPVARYYGARHNTLTGRHELYLEYVDDWNLKYHELRHWFVAARYLARLHAHFAATSHCPRACDFLLQLDEAYFREWAERAEVAAGQLSDELAQRLRRVREQYAPVADLLAAQRPTLVHNDLAPKNVIADRRSTPVRICFVDWELAGIGCALLDLVHLKYGLDPDSDREMVTAYRAELRPTDLLPADETEFGRLLAACELHKTLYRIAHSAGWRLPVTRVAQWASEAETFLEVV